jgi:hypothetical protein
MLKVKVHLVTLYQVLPEELCCSLEKGIGQIDIVHSEYVRTILSTTQRISTSTIKTIPVKG